MGFFPRHQSSLSSDRLNDTKRRVELLQSTEQKMRQRLVALEGMLQALRHELEVKETAPGEDKAAEEKTPASSEATSDEEEAEPSEERSNSQIRAL